jgi:tRNA (cmo5U34)-methyltransferase
MTTDDTVWQSPDLARRYLSGVRSAIPSQPERIEIMLRLLVANDKPVRFFLDLGCGDGVLGAAILTRFPKASGAFVDFSEPMLAAARAQLDNGEHAFWNIDYGDPEWVADLRGYLSFDAIVSGFSIHHQPDARKHEIYREIYDLLDPGGIFINIEHVKSATPWGEQVFDTMFVDRLTAYNQALDPTRTRADIAAEFYNRPDKAANILAPVETQLTWLREIGFVDVDCYSKTFELCLMAGRKANKA